MRTVVPTNEVFHLWANEAQEHARNASQSVRFNYSIAYSYQTPIGRIIRNARGERAFLVTTQRYSVTSTGHVRALRDAIPYDAPVFHVEYLYQAGRSPREFEADRELIGYAERIAEAEAKAKRARIRKDMYLSDAAELRDEASRFAQFFGIADSYSPELIEQLRLDAVHARALRLEAEQQRQLAAEREQEKRVAAQLPMWRKHETNYLNHSGPAYLRLSEDGQEVETSHGARVPVRDAERLFRLWMRGAAVRALPVGVYHAISATSDAITIGCHIITRQEAESFAAAVGWTANLERAS